MLVRHPQMNGSVSCALTHGEFDSTSYDLPCREETHEPLTHDPTPPTSLAALDYSAPFVVRLCTLERSSWEPLGGLGNIMNSFEVMEIVEYIATSQAGRSTPLTGKDQRTCKAMGIKALNI